MDEFKLAFSVAACMVFSPFSLLFFGFAYFFYYNTFSLITGLLRRSDCVCVCVLCVPYNFIRDFRFVRLADFPIYLSK